MMKILVKDKAILLLSIFILINVDSVLCKKSNSRKKNVNRDSKEYSTEINPCNIKLSETPIYCTCMAPEAGENEAESANCLIIEKFNVTHPLWGIFKSQINLQKLAFDVKNKGELNQVPTNMLKQFRMLRKLGFHNGNLNTIESKAFAEMPTLTHIYLNRSYIHSIGWHAFEGLKNLEELVLDNNLISDINTNQFYEVPKILKFRINSNELTEISDDAFKHLPTLIELEINDNKVARITKESFNELSNLQILRLRNNAIEKLPEKVFSVLINVQEIDLENNKISEISVSAFEGLKNLRRLNLSVNKLVKLESDVLAGLMSLNSLDFRNNNLMTINFDDVKHVITHFYPKESELYLGGNKFICDCKLAWIYGFRNETNSTSTKKDLHGLKCYIEATNELRVDENEQETLNGALAIARNSGRSNRGRRNLYQRYPEDNHEDYEDEDDIVPKVAESVQLNGKEYVAKNLYEFEPEDLPCPKPTKELMASEEPSDRRDHTSSNFFSFAIGSQAKFEIHHNLLALTTILTTFIISQFFT